MKFVLRQLLALTIAVVLCAVGATTALAAAPVNDNLADATAISNGDLLDGTTVDSTVEVDEGFVGIGWSFNNSAWYKFTPATSGLVTINVCAAKQVNLIAGYGSTLPLTTASFSPASFHQGMTASGCVGGTYPAQIGPFPATAGQALKIHVGSAYGGASEQGTFKIGLAFTASPANDNLADAQTINDGQTLSGTTIAATTELSEGFDSPSWGLSSSAWYKFDVPSAGLITITACAEKAVNLIAGFGSGFPLDSQDAAGTSYAQGLSASSCPGGTYPVTAGPFRSSGGQSLKIHVGSAYPGLNEQGTFSVGLEFVASPANDALDDATPLADDTLTDGSTVASTTDAGEDFDIAHWSFYNSVWYSYTAPSNGVLSIEACSEKPLTLAAAIGSDYPLNVLGGGYWPYAITQRTAAPLDCGYPITMSVPVTSGMTVKIHLSSAYGGFSNQGDFQIIAAMESDPVGDELAGAIDLGGGATVDQAGDNYATDPTGAQAGEPNISGSTRPSLVWYRWNSPITGTATIDTCGTWGDLALGVFTASVASPGLGDLTTVADGQAASGCASGDGAKVTIQVVDDTDYWIAVASDAVSARDEARFTLAIRTGPGSTDLPTLGGSTSQVVGDLLATTNGSWLGSAPITYTYKWLRCDVDGDNCAEIAGQTGTMYTTTASDDGSRIRSEVTASNATGAASIRSAATPVFDVDTDDDGFNDTVDRCPNYEVSGGKTNGCPVEGILLDAGSSISGSAVLGQALTVNVGAVHNSPGYDPDLAAPTATVTWYSCESATFALLTCRAVGGTGTTYTPLETGSPTTSDGNRFIHAMVTWNNDDNAQIVNMGSATAMVVDACPSQSQGAGKTNGCPTEQISIGTIPSLSGSAATGQPLTLNIGAASNNPGLDPDVDAPSSTTHWYSCSSPTVEATCQSRAGSGTTYTTTGTVAGPGSDVNRYIRAEVVWSNDDGTEESSWTVATALVVGDADDDGVLDSVDACPSQPQGSAKTNGCPNDPPPTTTPPAATQLDLTKLVTGKISAKGIVKSKGKFSVKSVTLACPAGGAACTFALDVRAKIKKKSYKLGKSSLVVAAGESKPLAGKLSKSGLKLFKKNKKVKASLTVTGTGGATGKATFKEFTVSR